jgi:CubicO group peptidase (beta-lactamase class C family)
MAFLGDMLQAPMGPRMRVTINGALLLLLLFTADPLAAPSAGQTTRAKQLEDILTNFARPGEPGLAVLIKRDKLIIFDRGYGVRKLGAQAAITSDSDFRLASVTKQFTAMAIMLLVRDGKLRYDTALTEIFPQFPPYGRAITIRHLLTHTSGLPDYEDLMDQAEKLTGKRWSPEHQIQDEEVLALLEKESAGKFAPGTKWAYSNSGYVILGLVIAKASGISYGEFLERRIFAPLHLENTLVYRKGKRAIPNRAFGHGLELGKIVVTDQSSTSATKGDGGIYSNLDDLSKWDDALANHTLLPEADMLAAITPVKLADGSEPHWPTEADSDSLAPGKPVSYGFGWFLDPYQGHTRMWHSGSTMGFRTVIERFTNDHLTIVILCNRADLDPSKLALKIADLYLEKIE